MNSTLRTLLLWMVVFVVVILLWKTFEGGKANRDELSFTQFLEMVQKGRVAEVTIRGQQLTGNDSIELRSEYQNVDLRAHSDAACHCFAGEATCFLINAASYLTVIVALAAIRVHREVGHALSSLDALKAGIRYAFGIHEIRMLLAIVAAVSFSITPYTVLMPYFAKEVFGGGPRVLGILMSAAGVGALTATLYLASRKSIE